MVGRLLRLDHGTKISLAFLERVLWCWGHGMGWDGILEKLTGCR
jgi:hypothetical protein